jgi:BirA family biotin operon repressor/biotin-[acetyl-CoA-carboxylase] ligase
LTAGRGASADVHLLGEQILSLFHRSGGDLLSGEALSEGLGVSRTAIWKQIRGLRLRGFEIEAVPGRGYRFLSAPDQLSPGSIAAGLQTTVVGREIIAFPEVGSTNTEAFRLAESGALEGTVVLAELQNRGKGRLGRKWESPGGVNIYCSVILRPAILPVATPQLTFVSSLAVCRAIETVPGLSPLIKWPNDILLGGRKVAGLLNELSAETDRVNFLVLGIGLNVNMAERQFPPDLRHPATSLAIEAGHHISRLDILRALLTELDGLYARYLQEGFSPLKSEWEKRSSLCGRRVRVSSLGDDSEGVAVGIDDDGALLVRNDNGGVNRVLAGDVMPMP